MWSLEVHIESLRRYKFSSSRDNEYSHKKRYGSHCSHKNLKVIAEPTYEPPWYLHSRFWSLKINLRFPQMNTPWSGRGKVQIKKLSSHLKMVLSKTSIYKHKVIRSKNSKKWRGSNSIWKIFIIFKSGFRNPQYTCVWFLWAKNRKK